MRRVRVRHRRLRLASQPLLAGIKPPESSRECAGTRAEWNDDAIAEGVLSDDAGWLVEATAMNLFWQRAGRLETPRLTRCGVAGTLREALISRLDIHEVEAVDEALANADAAWLGNSVQGVWPVVRLDDAAGVERRRWALGVMHRTFQAEAHTLLGYPCP